MPLCPAGNQSLRGLCYTGVVDDFHPLFAHFPAGDCASARSTSANRATLFACALGTFSHTTCYPIDFRLLDRSAKGDGAGSRCIHRMESGRERDVCLDFVGL